MRLPTTALLAMTLLTAAGLADRALAWPPDLLPADALPLKAAPRAGAPALRVTPDPPAAPCCAILELRQYTLKPGQRDTLVALFDRYFLAGQEAAGSRVVGQFRDLDDPDRFVWLRGFADMPARATGLAAFYGGPVWLAHREAANATMLDSDNVLLLRPAVAGAGFADATPVPPPVTPSPAPLPPAPLSPGAPPAGHGILVATLYYPFPAQDVAAAQDLADAFARDGASVLATAGGPVLAAFVTNPQPNNFPRLPVREGEAVFVTFQAFADAAAYERYRARVATPWWRGHVLKGPPEVHRLAPTSGSRWRGPF
ncbi:NIPSNAP family protein [Nitrospirillum sp. BR 11163]|uniref:NIPSNAP family protein n=1 Tax=Nitrospirillum sp. BR 11163 TaxID=3104323 RepID=UPI002AFDE60A|nr:NIPSNAP family protein [Nitrospirillum sp. BR 11163]MEA1674007.1 NIPSNAP family protein [Nitrospirillum sp. BR 11163]